MIYLPIFSWLWLHYLSMNENSMRHYNDVLMSATVSQLTNLANVYSTVYSGDDQRKRQSSASLAFVRWPVHSPHKGPVTWKMFPLDDVIMNMGKTDQYHNTTKAPLTTHHLHIHWLYIHFISCPTWKQDIAISKYPTKLTCNGNVID